MTIALRKSHNVVRMGKQRCENSGPQHSAAISVLTTHPHADSARIQGRRNLGSHRSFHTRADGVDSLAVRKIRKFTLVFMITINATTRFVADFICQTVQSLRSILVRNKLHSFIKQFEFFDHRYIVSPQPADERKFGPVLLLLPVLVTPTSTRL